MFFCFLHIQFGATRIVLVFPFAQAKQGKWQTHLLSTRLTVSDG